jgi:type IV pilus assembly protein PilF
MTTRLITTVSLLLAITACSSNPAPPGKRENAAAINVQLGIAYLHQGNIVLAKEKLDKALEEGPRDPNVHSALALLYDRMNKPAKADEEFRTALRLSPSNPEIVNNYAVYLCRTGRTDEGVKYFMSAAHNALYSTPAAAYTNAGVCLREAHRYDIAAQQFQQALAVRPNYAEAAFQLAELHYQRGELTDARVQLDRFLGAFDATPDLLLLGVRITRAQGDRLASERFDFPTSDQTRALSELDRNRG